MAKPLPPLTALRRLSVFVVVSSFIFSPVLQMLNLSAVCFLAFPLLGVVVPLVLWSLKKGAIQNIDTVAKRVINFQISWLLLVVVLWVVLVIFTSRTISTSGVIDVKQITILLAGGCVMYAVNLIYIIVNAILLTIKRTVVYQPAISFFRS